MSTSCPCSLHLRWCHSFCTELQNVALRCLNFSSILFNPTTISQHPHHSLGDTPDQRHLKLPNRSSTALLDSLWSPRPSLVGSVAANHLRKWAIQQVGRGAPKRNTYRLPSMNFLRSMFWDVHATPSQTPPTPRNPNLFGQQTWYVDVHLQAIPRQYSASVHPQPHRTHDSIASAESEVHPQRHRSPTTLTQCASALHMF